MSFRILIPARYDSCRLPGKVLLPIAGKPMLEHVYRRACESGADGVAIATDDERVAEAASAFGADVVMTAREHASGTDRLAEAARKLGYANEDVVVNLQGDEPMMPPELLRQVADDLREHARAHVATLCAPIDGGEEIFDPNAVKVVFDAAGYAMYFSRAPIAWERESFGGQPPRASGEYRHYRHIGLYAYRAGFLQNYSQMTPCDLERMEALEQLRVLWHGGHIHVCVARTPPPPGVDTRADLERVRALLG